MLILGIEGLKVQSMEIEHSIKFWKLLSGDKRAIIWTKCLRFISHWSSVLSGKDNFFWNIIVNTLYTCISKTKRRFYKKMNLLDNVIDGDADESSIQCGYIHHTSS